MKPEAPWAELVVLAERERDLVREGRWEERDTKSNYDAVLLSETGQVKEVRFSGQKRVFVFNE